MPAIRSKAALSAAVVALFAASICVAGLRAQEATQAAPATAAAPVTREVVDEIGRTIRLPLVPMRIVSLAPNITETLYALGLQDHLVGDTDFCDYPPDAQKKQKVGGAINPNLEEIAALHPDVVLVKRDFNRLDTVRALDTLGIPSYVTDPQTVEQIISSTEKLAGVLGAPEAGKTLAADLQHRLAALQTKLQPVTPSHVLFIVWTEPLISIGKETFVADALRRAGAESIVDSTQSWPHMSLEEVVHLQPEYLVFAPSHSESAANDFEALATRPGWRILDAVHNKRYVVVSDAVIRPAPRIVNAIEELARQLHPTAFQEAPGTEKDTPAPPPAPSATPASPIPPQASSHALALQESSCAR